AERLIAALPARGRGSIGATAGTSGRRVPTREEHRTGALGGVEMPPISVTVGAAAIPNTGFALGGIADGDREAADAPFDALGFLAAHVVPLCQSNRRRFWGALYALVAGEYGEAPPDYDRTAWAMEHASEGLMMTALARTVPVDGAEPHVLASAGEGRGILRPPAWMV
ncbi:MAG TPA: hypothetical protein VGE72_13120, partial [Azospirillum sp.]